jgi:hypothetical protein
MNTRFILWAVGLTMVFLGIVLWTIRYSKPHATTRPVPAQVKDYANSTTAELRFTTLGPVVSNSMYRSNTITVTPSSNTIQVFATYENATITEQNYRNNQAGFQQFVGALQAAGFSAQRASARQDVGSSCPIGNRYLYQIYDSGNLIMNLWATSCYTSSHSFNGNVALVNSLFQLQIPNISEVPHYQSFISQQQQ